MKYVNTSLFPWLIALVDIKNIKFNIFTKYPILIDDWSYNLSGIVYMAERGTR